MVACPAEAINNSAKPATASKTSLVFIVHRPAGDNSQEAQAKNL
jgi:hypothetical protein